MRFRFNARRIIGDLPPVPSPPNDGCAIFASGYWRSLSHPWSPGVGRLFLPHNYTPSYRYPLICYLHDDNASDRDLANWFPLISDQNFLAVAVRAPFPTASGIPGSYRWSLRRPDATGGVILEAIRAVGERYSIHRERVYLMGEGIGGVAGFQHFLLQHVLNEDNLSEVQGLICLGLPEDWPELLPPVSQGEGRLLLCNSRSDAGQQAALDGLTEAGFHVSHAHVGDGSITALINHWVLETIPTLVV